MFNLPSYIKGKSFAEASKAIEKKFEGKSDKFSNDTKETFMKRLSEAQEYTKMQEQELNPSSETNEMKMGGNPLEAAGTAMNLGQMAFGNSSVDTSGNTDMTGVKANQGGMAATGALQGAQAGMQFGPWGVAVGGVVGGAAGLIGGGKKKKDLAEANMNNALMQNAQFNSVFAMGGYTDPTEPTLTDKEKKDVKSLNNAQDIQFTGINPLNDFAANPAPPQLDLGKYADLGFYDVKMNGNEYNVNRTDKNPYNYVKHKENMKYLQERNPNANIAPSRNTYAKGGKMSNDYAGGGFPDFTNLAEYIKNNPQGNDEIDYSIGAPPNTQRIPQSTILANSGLERKGFEPMMPGLQESALKGSQELINNTNRDNNTGNNSSNNKTSFPQGAGVEALRYAPLIGNALQLANLDKPDYERLDRLDNRYQKDMFDEQSLINNVNSNYNKNYVKESSGGSLGSFAANSAAAELNKTRAVSEGFQRGEQVNRQENTTAQQFNLGVDRQNLNQANQENDINARNEGNYDTQKSKMISQIGNDLGNIGREQSFKQMVKDSGLCYDTSGAYICGSSQRLTEEQVKEVKSETNENAKGGMINSNSMFTSYLDYLKNK